MTTFFQYTQDTTLSQVKDVLNSGLNINTTNEYGCTLLHNACMYDHNDIVEFLLKNKAKTNIKNVDNEYPIDYARINNNKELLIILYRNIYWSNCRKI